MIGGLLTTGGVWAGILSVPVVLSHNDAYKTVFGSLVKDWKPLGLCLGLASVTAGQLTVLAYQRLRFSRPSAEMDKLLIQPKKHVPYEYWEGAVTHLSQPEGVLLLVGYLTATWQLGLMQTSYYSFEGGVSWGMVAAQLLLTDAFQTGMHLVEHQITSLYRQSHKPHHKFLSPKLFDAFNGSVADTVLMILIPLFATQRLVPANSWSYMAFGSLYGSWLTLIHSEWVHPWDGVFEWLGFGTPADHHVHHSIFNKNFGHLFTYWDRLTCQYVDPWSIFRTNSASQATSTRAAAAAKAEAKGVAQP